MSLTHQKARRMLFMDSPLPPGMQAALQEHLHECPGCRLYAQQLEQDRVGFRQLRPQARLDASELEGMVAAVNLQQRRFAMQTKVTSSVKIFAWALLVIALIFFLGWAIRSQVLSPSPAAPTTATPTERVSALPTGTGPGESTTTTPERTPTPGKAMLWYRWYGLPGDPGYGKVWDLVDQFNRAHPEVFLVLATIEDDSRLGMVSSDIPGIVGQESRIYDCFTEMDHLWHESDVYWTNPEDYLLDLNAFFAREGADFQGDFSSRDLDSFRKDEELYALPAYNWVDVLAYRRDLLAKRGLQPPANDWTFEDFTALIEGATSTAENDPSYGYGSFQYDMLLFEGRGLLWADWEYLMNTDPPRPKFNSPEMISTLAWIVELNLSSKVLSWMPSRIQGEEPPGLTKLQNAKEAGQVAFWEAGLEDIRRSPIGMDETGLVPIPSLPVENGWLSRYHTRSHFISKKSAHPQVCWEWIKILSEQPDIFEGIPARISVAESPAWETIVGKANAEVLRLALSRAIPAAPMYLPKGKDLVRKPLLNWFGEAVGAALGGTDPAQALEEAQAKSDVYLTCMQGVDPGTVSYEELESKVNECTEQAGTQVSQDYAEAMANIRTLTDQPDLQLSFQEVTVDPNANLRKAIIFIDSQGTQYWVDFLTNNVLEYTLVSPPEVDRTQLKDQQELSIIAENFALQNSVMYAMLRDGLRYEEGSKGDIYFFRWENRNVAWQTMPPLLQIGVNANGEIVSYINTLDISE